jgi:hypothetical protein
MYRRWCLRDGLSTISQNVHVRDFRNAEPKTSEISFITILLAVQIEAFLWGFGTALGELPPYFIARHAAEVEEKLKQVEQEHNKKLN